MMVGSTVESVCLLRSVSCDLPWCHVRRSDYNGHVQLGVPLLRNRQEGAHVQVLLCLVLRQGPNFDYPSVAVVNPRPY